MAKTKTIQEQICEMEERCNKLENLQKLFEKAVKNEFGYDIKNLHQIIKLYESNKNVN